MTTVTKLDTTYSHEAVFSVSHPHDLIAFKIHLSIVSALIKVRPVYFYFPTFHYGSFSSGKMQLTKFLVVFTQLMVWF
jgi:hypothetical protein